MDVYFMLGFSLNPEKEKITGGVFQGKLSEKPIPRVRIHQEPLFFQFSSIVLREGVFVGRTDNARE